jgi:serine/threonine protein phosphatase PrpC
VNFLVSAVSDIGIKRSNNQDSLSAKIVNTSNGQVLFAIICDGMGGLSKGELASATIIRAFNHWFNNDLPKLIHKKTSKFVDELKTAWENIVFEQNAKLKEYGSQNELQLGSTITALLCFDGQYYIIHVGDTRAYMITSDGIVQLTKDQTLLQREIDSGNLTDEEIANYPKKNVLLQCVGVVDNVTPYFYTGEITENVSFLLCSDGFRHEISIEEISEKLKYENLTDEIAMNRQLLDLTDLNKERLEKDNISSIVVKVSI